LSSPTCKLGHSKARFIDEFSLTCSLTRLLDIYSGSFARLAHLFALVPLAHSHAQTLARALARSLALCVLQELVPGFGICECLDGYVGDPYMGDPERGCEPVCTEPCVHGTCDAPDHCACESGWSGAVCAECVPGGGVCADNATCAPNADRSAFFCSCNSGYDGDGVSSCHPVCTQGCINGQCVAPGVCDCYPGFESRLLGNCTECVNQVPVIAVGNSSSQVNNAYLMPCGAYGMCTGNVTLPGSLPAECVCDAGYEWTIPLPENTQCTSRPLCRNAVDDWTDSGGGNRSGAGGSQPATCAMYAIEGWCTLTGGCVFPLCAHLTFALGFILAPVFRTSLYDFLAQNDSVNVFRPQQQEVQQQAFCHCVLFLSRHDPHPSTLCPCLGTDRIGIRCGDTLRRLHRQMG
jgi:hypothetical protein